MSETNLFGLKAPAKRKRTPPAPDGAVHKLVMLWVGLFERRFGEKPMITSRDGATLKRLVTASDAATVGRRLEQYLALDDAYLREAGYPLGVLPSVWNRLIAQEAPAAGGNKVPGSDETEDYLRSLRRR